MTRSDQSSSPDPWDFLVIGAQKAGTTTLHHLLVDHPGLALPAEKEAPIFDRTADRCEVVEHADRVLGPPDGRLRGKATPQYMCAPSAPHNIAAVVPDAKLIALVRDPVARARSHWKMRIRFGTDERTFAAAIENQLASPPPLDRTIDEDDGYIRFGEYGRVLAAYRSHFPADAMLVLHIDDLERDPKGTVDRVTAHLGVEAHTPQKLDQRFNVSTREGSRFPRAEEALWRIVPYDRALSFFSPRMHRRFGTVLDRFEINRPTRDIDDTLPPALAGALADHFAADLALLDGSDLAIPEITISR